MQPSIGEKVIGPATPVRSQQSPPPSLSPAPPTKKISDDSTFNVLHLNANGIGNKLTELEVVLERNQQQVVSYKRRSQRRPSSEEYGIRGEPQKRRMALDNVTREECADSIVL